MVKVLYILDLDFYLTIKDCDVFKVPIDYLWDDLSLNDIVYFKYKNWMSDRLVVVDKNDEFYYFEKV